MPNDALCAAIADAKTTDGRRLFDQYAAHVEHLWAAGLAVGE
ncbi:hypothetical protein [Plantactinospora endophytica]|nr:hypothetical protein [Plantactinospora endophytica]